MKIDYGLKVLPDTILRIANVEEFQWLLQPELKAIKDGLKYVEDKECFGYSDDEYGKYRGYINAKGQRQGVGIYITYKNYQYTGEWHEDEQHGIFKDQLGCFGIWGQDIYSSFFGKNSNKESYKTT